MYRAFMLRSQCQDKDSLSTLLPPALLQTKDEILRSPSRGSKLSKTLRMQPNEALQ